MRTAIISGFASAVLATLGDEVLRLVGHSGDPSGLTELKVLEAHRIERPRSSTFPAARVHIWSRSKPMQRDGARERALRLRQMGRPQLQAA